jgi:poly(hydroxyalkanoate) granule-associated protein
MVKKLKRISEKQATAPSGLLDGQLAASVKASAQQIWLAGMGAFAKAQEEGGKVFEALVKEGVGLQKKTQGLAEDKLGEVSGRMSAMAGSVSAKAGQNWDKLEAIFEQRTSKALSRLGVPTARDIDALVKRIDTLSAQVAKLNKASGAGKKVAADGAAGGAAAAADGAVARKRRSAARPAAATEPALKATAAKRAPRKSAKAA